MNLKVASLIAFGIVLIGVFYLFNKHYLFSDNPVSIIIQTVAAWTYDLGKAHFWCSQF